MNILRAQAMGFCSGVRRAIALAEQTARHQELTTWGELVHNPSVLDRLRELGVHAESDSSRIKTNTVMVTAHGISERTRRRLMALGYILVDGTCPLVKKAHRVVAQLVMQGFHPVIIGQRDHIEVRGLTEDFPEHDVILTEADAAQLEPRSRFGVVAQTTQPIERVRHLINLLQKRLPETEIRFIDTVCDSTKRRQQAAANLSRQVDVMIIIGGCQSNNTQKLVETCRQYCRRVYQVEKAAQLDRTWFVGARTVGLSAGTSTPAHVIDEVQQCLEQWNSYFNVREPEGDSYSLAGQGVGARV